LLLYPMTLPVIVEHAKWDVNVWEPLLRHGIFGDLVCTSPIFSSLMQIAAKRSAILLKDDKFERWFRDTVKIIKSTDDKMLSWYENLRNENYKKKSMMIYGTATYAEIEGSVRPVVGTITEIPSSWLSSNPMIIQFLSTFIPWINHPNLPQTQDDTE
jgi:hypothetical protein